MIDPPAPPRVGARPGRTPLFAAIRRWMALSRLSHRPGAPPLDELPEIRRAALSRREYLRASALGLSASAVALAARRRPAQRSSSRPGATDPRIAIVGDGLAGLNAAYVLARSGVRATVFGATDRPGGRVESAHGLLGPGLTTELGGEFINSEHADMLGLAREFGFPLLDGTTDPGASLAGSYLFGGRRHTEDQILAAFRPLAARIQADIDSLPQTISAFRHNPAAVRLDRTTLRDYLIDVGASGTIFDLLRLAYVAEYGLDDDQQSALNLLTLFNPDTTDGLDLLGDSDERYKVAGGNARVVDELARRLAGQIRPGHALVSLVPRGSGYALAFEVDGGGTVEVAADSVVLAIPFTALRRVDLRVPMSRPKRMAIGQLGYGTNSKILLGFHGRPWLRQGFSGDLDTDAGFQVAWDSGILQPVESGSLTLLPGGAAGVAAGNGTPADRASLALPGLDEAFPGAIGSLNGLFGRAYWPGEPYIQASYACYTPGQWTSISGLEGQPVGNLLFAGEHCSLTSQGYMDGAAQTGRLAAESLLARLGVGR